MSKINQYAAMALGMAAMEEAGMQDVYDLTNPYCDLPPITFGSGPSKFHVKDEKAFAADVEGTRREDYAGGAGRGAAA